MSTANYPILKSMTTSRNQIIEIRSSSLRIKKKLPLPTMVNEYRFKNNFNALYGADQVIRVKFTVMWYHKKYTQICERHLIKILFFLRKCEFFCQVKQSTKAHNGLDVNNAEF